MQRPLTPAVQSESTKHWPGGGVPFKLQLPVTAAGCVHAESPTRLLTGGHTLLPELLPEPPPPELLDDPPLEEPLLFEPSPDPSMAPPSSPSPPFGSPSELRAQSAQRMAAIAAATTTPDRA
jgi:hypothetical protein